ncbi:MFS family permease [Sporomusaceae bacterium BoRhaA]|uniref:MFS transporter n=1 Tax=Pelorhabdus rhamnosifermentans TaxID=2772457 RepID=UPI0028A7A0E7|nr:MFS transporter [Pelorhabdus rhamnosifermentans]MBU2700509.1 MFS family permease [Pelorhabdus rhamnosifermentans]
MNTSAIFRGQKEQYKWKALSTGCLAHFIHDGFTDMIYVFFPIWQAQWTLTFVEVGILKTLVSGSMALFQLPIGIVANLIGQVKLLLIGTVITSVAVMLWGFAISPVLLGLLLILGGLGSSVQHPVSSSVILDAYSDVKARRTALSTYNVAGDIGKLVLPGSAALLITYYGWQSAGRLLATVGLLIALIFLINSLGFRMTGSSLSKETNQPTGNVILLGWNGYQGFWSLSIIGVIDSATRMGFLTFLPFLLQEKGANVTQIGFTLTLIFAGGAAGKLICGILATRVGILRSVIITESVTAICITGMLVLSFSNALLLAPFLGVALNGTSSVLYGSVPELVSEKQRKQAFSIFYTMTLGAGAVSPAIYGTISDFAGIATTVIIVAVVLLATIPLTLPLRGKLVD